MANVSEWSANELENCFLDDMNLSDERGKRAAKIMAAVKAKTDDLDAKLDAVAGGLVFRGTKATYVDLEAVTGPAVGDMYSVTDLGGENYAWNGESWDSLGTSDSNVVHKTGNETISGNKTFNNQLVLPSNAVRRSNKTSELVLYGGDEVTVAAGARLALNGGERSSYTGNFLLYAMKREDTTDYNKALQGTPTGTLTWDGQPIQTSSDERLKTVMAEVPDAVLDAWGKVEWGEFRFLEAVASKGDAARLHVGLIAQRVRAVFEAEGLDACAYGILCHEEHPATETESAVDLWMVRYEEALAMEAAYQRRRADRMEARLSALEGALSGNV